MKNYSIILIVVFFVFSCGVDEDSNSVPFGHSSPNIYGIYLIDITGQEYGIYGRPKFNTNERPSRNVIARVGEVSTDYLIPMSVSPNPLEYNWIISFSNPVSSLVEIYVIRGNDNSEEEDLYPGGFNVNKSIKSVGLKLIRTSVMSPGSYSYTFSEDELGEYGFYRVYIYLPTEGSFNYVDILYTNNVNILDDL